MLPTVLSSKRTTRTESLISQAVMTTRTMQPDTRLRLKCQSVGLHQPPSRLLFSQCWHIIELHKQEEYAMFKASEALGNVIHCQNEKNPTTDVLLEHIGKKIEEGSKQGCRELSIDLQSLADKIETHGYRAFIAEIDKRHTLVVEW